MNTRTWLKTALLAIATSTMIIACDKDDDDDENDVLTLSGNATGAAEIPAVNTTATATLTGELNKTAKSLIYMVHWTGLSGNATAAHFHGPATASQSAPPIFTLTIAQNGTAGMLSGTITNIPDSTIAHFENGRIYYNIHTAANPNGEIRAQVITN